METKNERETVKKAEEIIKNFNSKNNRPLVLALTGELGAGKTSFVKGIANFLKAGKEITSPTFVIIKPHDINNPLVPQKHLYHIDAYRLNSPEEISKLGIKDILTNPANIVIIEWAEKIKKILPENTIWINFQHGDKKNKRIITVKNEKTSNNRR